MLYYSSTGIFTTIDSCLSVLPDDSAGAPEPLPPLLSEAGLVEPLPPVLSEDEPDEPVLPVLSVDEADEPVPPEDSAGAPELLPLLSEDEPVLPTTGSGAGVLVVTGAGGGAVAQSSLPLRVGSGAGVLVVTGTGGAAVAHSSSGTGVFSGIVGVASSSLSTMGGLVGQTVTEGPAYLFFFSSSFGTTGWVTFSARLCGWIFPIL